MLWTADFYNAEQALKIGLVNHVYEDETFTDQVLMFAAKIAAQPPVQVRAIKRTVYQSLHSDLRTSLELISSHMAIIQTTEDYREAINAYKEKRPGHYKGR
jgi:2-(1,2-epoxy-1,2-dihydrophenyl)acetyl-CoA isomerase